MPLVDGLEIEADLLADHGVVVFTGDVNDQGDETIEMVDARQDAHPRAFGEIVEVDKVGTLMLTVLASKGDGAKGMVKKAYRIEDVT